MAQAKKGDTVAVHYTGKLSNDSTFDTSRGREPLTFELGAGNVIPGFENGVVGMEPGETRTIQIDAADAYGPYNEDQVVEVERTMFPDDISPEVGQQLQVQQENGQPIPVVVREVRDSTVMLDANHPLAGEDLIFELELVSIEPAEPSQAPNLII